MLLRVGKLSPIPTSADRKQSKAALESLWPIHYAALLEYCKQNGHCNVPASARFECDLPGYGEDGCVYHYEDQLGEWLSVQREKKRVSRGTRKLDPEREFLLQQLVNQGDA